MKKLPFEKDTFVISTQTCDSKVPCIIINGFRKYDVKEQEQLLKALLAFTEDGY